MATSFLSEAGEAFRLMLASSSDSDDDTSDEENGEKASMSAAHWASVRHPLGEKLHFLHKSETDSSDKVPAAEQTMLAAVAASIIHSTVGMGHWGLAEVTLGLYKVYCRHARERVVDSIAGRLVTSTKELSDFSYFAKWAKAAYGDSKELVLEELKVDEKDIVHLSLVAAFGRPSYFIGLDHVKKAVVWSIRGTHSAVDVLTDLKPHSEKFGDGRAHSGMLNSALWLQETSSDTVKELMEQHKYRLIVTGHSLGAGTATLLTMLLRRTNESGMTALGVPPDSITCWGYGCPPCVDKTTAMNADFIKNLVHQDDIVSRISPAALEDLRAEITETEWSHALEDGTSTRKLVEAAQSSLTVLDKLEPALNLEKGQIMKTVQAQSWSAMASISTGFTQTWSKALSGGYGAKYGQAASIISRGVTVATNHLTAVPTKVKESARAAIDKQLKLIDEDKKEATFTASSLAAEAVASSEREGKSLLEERRLFVPGVLFHLLRRPLTAEEKEPQTQAENEKCTSETPAYKCLLIKGDDPTSRFRRIVLSSSILSDHRMKSIIKSLAQCAQMAS